MKLSQAFIAGLLMAVAAAPHAHAKGWRDIVPLLSTRADVERALGRPAKQPAPDVSVFDLPWESVVVVYAQGPCVSGVAGGWHVTPGTVLSIEVTPKNKPKRELMLKDTGLDVTKYKKTERTRIKGRVTYTDVTYANEEEGISIDTLSRIEYASNPEQVLVKSIKYGPRSTEEHMRCKSPEP